MLKKELRLLGPIPRQSRVFESPLFNIKVARDIEGKKKFGFVVSKKIDKRAVVRNRIKRKIRNVIEEHSENIMSGFDFLFIVKKPSLSKNRKELESEILGALKKEKLYV